ncbi:DNA primase [Bradyrhizobium sp. AZCC 1678]
MTVNFTNLDKVFWPKERYSKGDVIAYCEKIAPYLLPYVKDQAEALNRFPDGIKGNHFFRKTSIPSDFLDSSRAFRCAPKALERLWTTWSATTRTLFSISPTSAASKSIHGLRASRVPTSRIS